MCMNMIYMYNMNSICYNVHIRKTVSSLLTNFKIYQPQLTRHCTNSSNGKFRVLDLKKKKVAAERRSRAKKPPMLPPRSESMPVDQDWVSIWPGPRSFHPASVPLPVRQGYPVKDSEAPPGKFANAELMKLPNFLHLTPPAIKRHCEAIKHFCTPWPSTLQTDEDCEKIFPVEISTNDFCHSGPSVRNPLSRITTLKVKFTSLALDSHAADKFIRLVAERYNPASDTVTIFTDRCPTRKQNMDYAKFLLAALFHESWKVEPWEKEKSLADMEVYDWQTSVSRASVDQLAAHSPNLTLDQEVVLQYAQAVTSLIDEGEDIQSITKYKDMTKKLLSLDKAIL